MLFWIPSFLEPWSFNPNANLLPLDIRDVHKTECRLGKGKERLIQTMLIDEARISLAPLLLIAMGGQSWATMTRCQLIIYTTINTTTLQSSKTLSNSYGMQRSKHVIVEA